jgi:hypothetical protein
MRVDDAHWRLWQHEASLLRMCVAREVGEPHGREVPAVPAGENTDLLARLVEREASLRLSGGSAEA